MNPDKEKSLKAMRTFARDLDRERGGSEQTKTVSSKKKEHTETPKAPKKKDAKPVTKKKEVRKEHIVADKPKEDKPKHIPAFHELQKAVKDDVQKESKEIKKKKAKKAIKASRPVGGGTIITDTKKEKRSFFSALFTSFGRWFSDLQKSLQPKKKNTYAVAKTERRKGVVQKATSKTGTIFSADNKTLKEQIKARQRAERRKEGDVEEDLSWSPYTEPGYALLEGEEEESADPRVTRITVAHKTHTVPKPVIKSTEKIAELQEPEEESVPEPEPKPVPPPVPEPIPEPEVEEVEEPTEDYDEEPKVEIEEEEMIEEDRWDLGDISLRDTNTLALLLVGIVLSIAVIGLIMYNFFGVGKASQEGVMVEEPALLTGSNEDVIVLSNASFNELSAKTNTAFATSQNGIPWTFTYVNEVEQPVPAEVLMNTIQSNHTDGFANSVSNIAFIKTGDGDRALVLIASDQVASLGGMLNWEDFLLSDVGPLLDVGDVPRTSGVFNDTQFGELDVRAFILGDRTLLVYAVLKNGDVIIGDSIAALIPFSQN